MKRLIEELPVIGAFLFMGAVLFAAIVLGWGDPPI